MCVFKKIKLRIQCGHHLPNIKELIKYKIAKSMHENPYYIFFFQDRFYPRLETIYEGREVTT